jgi:hypothetical protein
MPKQQVGGTYLYAVIAGPADRTYGPIGIDDRPVYTVSNGKVAGVVSDLTQRALRPERRYLAAHQRVLQRLLADGTPMPMSFGVIADGAQDIRRTLALNEDLLTERLECVRGRVEMGLRARWDVPDLFAHLVARHAELRAARDRAFGGDREPSHEERLTLGRLVERLLTAERAAATEQIEQALRPRCVEIKESTVRDERELTSLACLIERGTEEAFAQAVVEAASHFDASYCFDYNGPWAPHSFVAVSLEV